MQMKLIILLMILFLLSACGVDENPASNDDIGLTSIDEDVFIETENLSPKTTSVIITTPQPTITDFEPERESLEPLIIRATSWIGFNYIIDVIGVNGIVKRMEYEHDNIYEHNDIDMYRFAEVIYNQMNDDSFPVTVLFDEIPNNIINLIEVVETLELDVSVTPRPGDAWIYYVIISEDEDRRAVMIGDKWGPLGGDDLGGNILTRAINEYLETTERREP